MLRRQFLPNCLLGFTLFFLLGIGGCHVSPYDVELSAPDQKIDVLNPALPPLAAALPKNPGANTFRLTYSIVPDATKKLEAIPHFLIYDRKAKTLEIHRDRATFETFSGVSDAILTRVAAQNGGMKELMSSCKMSSQPEK